MSYAPLFGIDITHSYYADGRCADFSVAPDAATQQLLRNHRCLAKAQPTGINVYVQTDPNGDPVIPFAGAATLVFNLCLNNREFALFTDLSRLPTSGTVHISYAAALAAPVYAQVAVTRNFNQAGGERAVLAFSAKPLRWVYYLLTAAADTGGYVIADANTPPQYAWALNTDPDPVATALATGSPGLKLAKFLSDQPIPCQELGLANIQLKRQGGTANGTLQDHLPTPDFRDFLQIDVGGAAPADAAYRAISFLSTPK